MAQIKKKGFNMPIQTDEYQIPESANGYVPIDFSKIRVGVKTLSDAVYKLGDFQRVNPRLADKRQVLEAIHYGDLERMRDISNYFYKISGIYQRLCRYMAYMYRYDWLVTPYYNKDTAENFVVGFSKEAKELLLRNKTPSFLWNLYLRDYCT